MPSPRSHRFTHFAALLALAAIVPLTTCSNETVGLSTLPPIRDGVNAAAISSDEVLVGAGDIARCDRTDDERTAAVLDTIPGTVFTLGDNVLGSSTQVPDFTNCYDPSWGRHKARTHPANDHLEYWIAGASTYFDYFGSAAGERGKGYYSYELGAWHIVVLNTGVSTAAGSPQELWLKADLAASTKRCTLAYWHMPRFSSTGTAVRDAVKPLWDDLYAAGAELVLNAHYDVYERFAPQTPAGVLDAAFGIRQFTVGTGGMGTGAVNAVQPNSEVRNPTVYGVLKLTLSTDGYAWQFIRSGGSVFTDAGSGSCHDPASGGPPVATVDVTPAAAPVQVGQTVQLTATVKDANGNILTGRTVAWTSSNTSTATVSATGLVTGVAPGPATITATSEGKNGSAGVTVTAGAVSASQSTVAAAPASLTAGSGSSTITVTVKDAGGNPISGATVVLAATGSGNTLTQPSGTTDAAGVATGTLGSTGAGAKTISATASGTAITQTAAVTVTPGPLSAAQSTVTAAPPSIAAGSGTSTITVTAKDANGNPIGGATVVLAATGSGNTLTQPSGTTDATGVATGTLSATVAEPKTVSATIGGTAVTQTAAVTVMSGAVSASRSTVTAAPPSLTAGSGSSTITVTVKDASGNPIAGATVVLAATGSGNTLTQPSGTTDAAGVATGTLGSTGAGAKTVSATAGGTAITQTATVSVTPGAVSAAQSTVTAAPPSIAAGGETSTITVTAKDANGNPISEATVVLAATGTGNTLTQPSGTTDATGVATGTISTTVAEPKTVSATINGTAITQTAAVTVTSAPVSASQSTVAAAPTSLTEGSGSSTVTVTVKDAGGNPITGATVLLAATGSGNTLTQPSGTTDAAGVATGTLSSTGAGTKTVSASAGGTAITQTATVTVAPGPVSAAQSTVTAAPASITAGSGTSTITVTAKDASGNPIGGATVVLAATGSSNTLTQPSGLTDGTGVATGTFSSTVAESKTVSATINGTAITQTAAVTVTSAPVSASQSTVAAAPTSITAGNGSTTITVTVKDAGGNPISGATVVLATTGSGNTLTQPSGTTDATGVATGTLSSTGAGTKTVSATANGTAITQTATVTVAPGPVSAAQSTVTAAPPSIAAGSATSTITVTARDANGNPIGGAPVVLAATGTGNTLTQPGGPTDATGVATGTLRSTAAGAKTISATIDGIAVTQTATVTVTPGPVSAAQSTVTAAPPSIATGSGTSTITVTAKDANGNPIGGATAVLAATGSGNTLTQPGGPTDATGVATGTLSSTVAGTKTVSATISGTAITQTAAVSVANAPVASVTVSPATASVPAGQTLQLTATLRDAGGNILTGRTVTWTSSNTSVATVSSSGLVTALAAGPATITATSEGQSGTAAITVTGGSTVTLVGAGDIASCSSSGDEATATLLDGIAGTVFTLGDNAYENGSTSDYTTCYNPTWGRHKARTRPTVGNHEYNTSGAAGYFGYFGAAAGDPAKGYYSYDLGEWHVVVVNNYVPMNAGSAQEQWLRADLSASTKQCTLAMWHEPLFSSGPIHGGNPGTAPLWQALYEGGAEIILAGHDHNYERFAPLRADGTLDAAFGVREFVVGTGGASLDGVGNPPAPGSEVRGTGWGVMKLTLQPGGYTWEFVHVAGGTLTDQGSASCHGAPATAPPVAKPGGPYASDGAVTFDGTASFDPQGDNPLTYAWDFGDGANGSGASPTHSYAASGNYTVTLVVTDSRGNPSAPATTTATIANQPPSVNAGPDRAILPGATVNLSATFTDNPTDTPWSYAINWGDGSATESGSVTSTPGQISSSHIYGNIGQFTLRVSVTDRRGSTGSDDAVVTVSDVPPPQVFVGAGDIARCDRTDDERTAAVLDTIPGTVFTLGDNVLGSSTQVPDFNNCYNPSWGRHKARTHPANDHLEYWIAGASTYFDYFGSAAGERGKGYYSYELGGWHIVVLNTGVSTAAGSPQELWLKADLAASTKRCTLAYWHMPRFSSTGTAVRDAVKPFWDDLYAAGAELVLNAHYDVYERFAPQTPAGVLDLQNGIREFIVGTGGMGTGSVNAVQPNSEMRNPAVYGVLKFILSADGYTWKFIPAAPNTFTDTGSGPCH